MITVIVPSFNEEASIKNTIESIHSNLKNKEEFEIILVNDGSTDKTLEIGKKLKCKIISHPHNLGYGKALKTGIINAKFDIIVIVDCDGSYPIDQLGNLISEFKMGYDMVVAARTGNTYKESFLKWPLRLLLRFLVEWTAGRSIPDINSGLRVFSKKDSIKFIDTLCDTFSFTTSLTLAYMLTGKFVKYIKVDYDKRVGKTHVKLWRDSLRTLQFIIQAIVLYHPLKIFLLITIFCFILAICLLMLGLLNSKIFIIPSFILFSTGLLIFGLGLLTDLIRQINIK